MKIKRKVLLAVGITTFVLITALHFSSQSILLGSFARIEEEQARKNVKIVLGAFDSDVAAMDTLTHDWAAWDDTYEFIADGNEEYIESNLTDTTFTDGARLNFILFLDVSGQVKFSKGFDLVDVEEAPIPTGLLEYLVRDKAIVNHAGPRSWKRGVVLLPDGPVAIASRPIVTSENEGPIRGTLIMGRYWNETEIGRLAETTHMPIETHRLDAPSMPDDFKTAKAALSKDERFFVRPSSDTTIAGYTRVNDIGGNPCLLLKAEMPRDIYIQAEESLVYYLAATALIGLAICALVYLLLKKMVVDRLVFLSEEVRRIGITSEPGARVAVRGGDELAFLGGAINKMLNSLAATHKELQESLEHIKTLRGIVPICSHCKKIRDSKGYWQQVEVYVRDHTEAEFSHGLCVDCMKELYPEEAAAVINATEGKSGELREAEATDGN